MREPVGRSGIFEVRTEDQHCCEALYPGPEFSWGVTIGHTYGFRDVSRRHGGNPLSRFGMLVWKCTRFIVSREMSGAAPITALIIKLFSHLKLKS